MTCKDLADWVNLELGLEGDNCYGESKLIILSCYVSVWGLYE